MGMFSSVEHSTTRRRAATPALWPAMRGRWCLVAQRPLPSMMMARCCSDDGAWSLGNPLPSVAVCEVAWEGDAIGCGRPLPFCCDVGTRLCNLVKLDLQNFQFLGFADFIHLVDEAVGE